jgi:hypothetical protein
MLRISYVRLSTTNKLTCIVVGDVSYSNIESSSSMITTWITLLSISSRQQKMVKLVYDYHQMDPTLI